MLLVLTGSRSGDRDSCGIDANAPGAVRHEGRKRIMTLNRVLALTSVALGALLVIQVVFAPRLILRASDGKPPAVRYMHASWVDNAATLKDGHAQSDHVILAEVAGLRKGPDLVVPAAGEPTGEEDVLFLKDMQPGAASALALAAVSPAMKRSLAPEGRYQVTKGDHLKPSTNRKGFAPNWKGRPLSDLESELAKQTTP